MFLRRVRFVKEERVSELLTKYRAILRYPLGVVRSKEPADRNVLVPQRFGGPTGWLSSICDLGFRLLVVRSGV